MKTINNQLLKLVINLTSRVKFFYVSLSSQLTPILKRKTSSIIFFFTIFFCVSTFAQRLNIRNYSVDDGLPQSQILDNFQDHTGAIWFSTNGGGISRFDGVKFTNYTIREGLNSNHAYQIIEDANQNLWIATAKGLNKMMNGKVVKIADTLFNQSSIYCIQKHSNGELWFGCPFGIVIYNGKSFSAFSLNSVLGNYQVSCIEEDKKGNTWIGTIGNGTFCYNGTTLIQFGLNEGLNDLKNRDILVNGNEVWIATAHGINTIEINKAFNPHQKLGVLEFNGKPYQENTYRLYKDSSGVIWIGNTVGVIKYFNTKTKLITKFNGLCNTIIDAIIKDREGNMWFGSFGGGVSKYRNNMFVNISKQQGLAEDMITALLKDKKGNIWVGTQAGGVSRLNYNAWTNSDSVIIKNFNSQKNKLASNTITGICEDKKGNIWFGTAASGVSKYNGKQFVNYDNRNGLSGVQVQAITADNKGNVWIANEGGVDKFDGESFTKIGKKQGFSAEAVSAIYEDNEGMIWFGCPEKIIRYDGKKYSYFMRSEGFPKVKNITKDKHGYIWFSTETGAVVFNGKIFRTINETEGLCSNAVSFIQSDANGNLIIGTNKGLDRLDLNIYETKKEIKIKHFGKEEGFLGIGCNQNSFYKDATGKLWVGTPEGITIFDPSLEIVNKVEPQLQLSDIHLFLSTTDWTKYSDTLINGIPQKLSLEYTNNHLTFYYVGISLSVPEKVKYSFKLEGADMDWSPETVETHASYPNLMPGKYTFLVRAKNNDGFWNPTPLSYTFEVVPPLYKRPWFYLMLIIIGGSIIFSLIKLRDRRLKYSKKLLERQVSIRTKQLFEEKEKLQFAYSEIDEKNKAITDSIHYAKRLQEALLPTDATIKQLLPNSFVLFKPKDIVSGDYYWVEQWGHQILIAAVDCTGHGVPGAFMSLVSHNILAQAVNVLGLSKPALILNEANKQISRKLNQHEEEATVMDGMDIALFAINYTKSTMEFAGANNPIWIIRNGELIEIKGNKFPIGAFMGDTLQKFTNHEWELQKGDYIYIFSDGYVDQFGGPKGKKFKHKQLQNLFLEIHTKPLDEQKEILDKTFEDWRGSLEQVDDVLIIGVHV